MGARSKCGTIASSSLWKRRFDVKFISKCSCHNQHGRFVGTHGGSQRATPRPQRHTPTYTRTHRHTTHHTHHHTHTPTHTNTQHTQAGRDLKSVLRKSIHVRAKAGELCLIRAYFRGDTQRYWRASCSFFSRFGRSLFPSGTAENEQFNQREKSVTTVIFCGSTVVWEKKYRNSVFAVTACPGIPPAEETKTTVLQRSQKKRRSTKQISGHQGPPAAPKGIAHLPCNGRPWTEVDGILSSQGHARRTPSVWPLSLLGGGASLSCLFKQTKRAKVSASRTVFHLGGGVPSPLCQTERNHFPSIKRPSSSSGVCLKYGARYEEIRRQFPLLFVLSLVRPMIPLE